MSCDSVTISSCIPICRDWFTLGCNIAVAVGTIGAVIVALKKEIVEFFFPAHLDIVKQKDNVLRYVNNSNTNQLLTSAFFYLKCTSNKKEKGVCVFLNKFEKKQNGAFEGEEYPVPLPFSWAGIAESEKRAIIYEELVFNFGCIVAGENKFKPVLNITPHDFNDYVLPGEVARYTLIITSEHTKPKKKIVEVSFGIVQNMADFTSLSKAISIKIEDA